MAKESMQGVTIIQYIWAWWKRQSKVDHSQTEIFYLVDVDHEENVENVSLVDVDQVENCQSGRQSTLSTSVFTDVFITPVYFVFLVKFKKDHNLIE